MRETKPYRQHLKSWNDLVTPYEATRAGFVALALERSRRATPFVEQAKMLKAVASHAKTRGALMKMSDIKPDIAALAPAGTAFVEELVYRFLLTRGDTLGGSMRNVGGVLAARKLSRAIISNLTVAGMSYQWLDSRNGTWNAGTSDDADIELRLRGLAWSSRNGTRTLVYNLTVPHVKKNVDMCLLKCAPQDHETAYRNLSLYVALGELKGGIDPAGADEHWKTAGTAFARIRKAFSAKKLRPQLFFVGAAIENGMAGEIWRELQEGSLCNAANLTDATHVSSLCRWLCNI